MNKHSYSSPCIMMCIRICDLLYRYSPRPYSEVKFTMKKSCNNYTSDKLKHKMCWEGIVLCQGMPKLCHLQTVSYMIKIYS